MELIAGQPYWLIQTGLPYRYPKLPENEKCSVAIIGGGISGALTTFLLTKAGVECILIDARGIGMGSTCASTSLLQYELDVPLHQLKKTVGDQNAIRAYQLCGEAIDKLCNLMTEISFTQFQTRPSLYFSQRKSHLRFLQQEMLARKEAGFEVDMVGSKELKKLYGLKAACGIMSGKGATNNAYALTHEILQYCLRKGCKIFERTSIARIKHKKDHVVLETKEGLTVKANYLVNATGYEVTNFIDKKIVDLDCTYAVISQPQSGIGTDWKDKIMMWNTDDPYTYLCPANDNRIVIGGRDERFVNTASMHTYLPRKERLLENDFRKLFPSIEFKKEFTWSGVFGKTKDSLPYIGTYSKTPHTFYALGFGGNGITFSLVAAEIIRDLILGMKNKDAEIFSFSR